MISPQGGYVTGSIWHWRLSVKARAIGAVERFREADGLDCNKECRRASRKHGTGSILLRIYMGWPGVRPLAACGITSLPPPTNLGTCSPLAKTRVPRYNECAPTLLGMWGIVVMRQPYAEEV